MSKHSATTLEQWEILLAVTELGSFAKTALSFNRSQSSISYKLQVLQERLGIELLTLVGRKAQLTPQGAVLLAQVTPLLRSFYAMENRATAMRRGERMALNLVTDSIVPKDRLFNAMRAFQQHFPAVLIHLTEVLRDEPVPRLWQRQADLYLVTRQESTEHPGRLVQEIGFIAVAHRSHPLLTLQAPLSASDLLPWPLIEMSSGHRQHGQPLTNSWTFTTVEATIEAISYGIGYGWLPEYRITQELEQGDLVPLPLAHGARRATPLYLYVNQAGNAFDNEVETLVQLLTS